MLKLTYTENGFYLEHLTQGLEAWVMNRVLLALRSGTSLCVEPTTAAFLLPRDLPYLGELEKLAQGENGGILDVIDSDADCIEIGLNGTWVAPQSDSDEGLFVCDMSDRAESFLYQLWQDAQFSPLVVNE